LQKITPQDIANFEKEYRHTEEEMSDLKQAYLDGEGSMKYILDSVLCCTDEDEERFTDVILDWIEKEEVPYFKAFRKLTAKEAKQRKKKADKEAAEAEKLAKELGVKDEDSLVSMIMKRQEKRGREAESFLDGLAEKYGSKSKKGKKGGKK
jgi:DnaJ family protein C protein 9